MMLEILRIFVAFLLGLIGGGYLNTLEYRLRTPIKMITAECYCPACGSKLKQYDQIPLVSYLILGGKCRTCGEKIGIRYPLVEAATMLVFGVAAIFLPSWAAILIGTLFELGYCVVSLGIRGELRPSKALLGRFAVGTLSLLWMAALSLIAIGAIDIAILATK